MDPITGAVLAGAGSLIQGLGSYKSAQKQMKFQREMSDTAIRRQMADMRAAGINPILAARTGGASTPGGSAYQIPNIGQAAVEGYKGASSAGQMQAQTSLAGKQEGLVEAQTVLSKEQARKVTAEIDKLMPEQIYKIHSEAKLNNANARLADTREALTSLQRSLLALDETAFKQLSRELGITVGPQTAELTVKAFSAATSSLDTMVRTLGSLTKLLPAGKLLNFVKRSYNIFKPTKGKVAP